MSIRKLYYRLPPSLRLIARKITYAPFDLFRKEKYDNGLPVPPRSLIFTGGGDFKATGERFVSYFRKHGLKKEHTVLDIGSGMGRMALPLTSYLIGEYNGLDIMHQGINWCKKNITSRFPNFKFLYIDVHNDLYRSSGESSETTSFPLPSGLVDYTILISVFTHMQPLEIEHYLNEINRCMVSGGTCFATFFIYGDDKTLTNNKFKPFLKQDHRYALMDEKVKAANVAFSQDFLWSIFEQSGFHVDYYSTGKWKNKNSHEDFQDFVVLRKK